MTTNPFIHYKNVEKDCPCVYWGDHYIGFLSKDKTVFLQRCGICRRENWGPAVSSGKCEWCKWDAQSQINKSSLEKKWLS